MAALVRDVPESTHPMYRIFRQKEDECIKVDPAFVIRDS
jgi:hypothetical protein